MRYLRSNSGIQEVFSDGELQKGKAKRAFALLAFSPSGEIRYIMVLISSSRNQVTVHRTLVSIFSNLPIMEKQKRGKYFRLYSPSGEVRINMVLPPSGWRQAKLHRRFALRYSNLPTKEKTRKSKCSFWFFGPSGEIRTPGILNPNQAPYQLGHTRKYKIEDLSKVAPYSRFAALSICKQNCRSATATKQLGHTRILKIYYTPIKRK